MSSRGNTGRGAPRGGGGGGGRGGGGYDSRGRGFGAGRGRGDPGPILFASDRPAVPDSRFAASNLDKLIVKFKKVAIKPELPLRPGYGTLGKEITLRANFFPLRLPKGPVFDYSVEFNPKTDINQLKGRIFDLLEQSPQCRPFLNHIAHDRNQRLVSAQRLPQPLDIQIQYYEDGQKPQKGDKTYTVSIVFVRELDMSQLNKHLAGDVDYRTYDLLPIISALNLVLQRHPTRAGAIRVGKNRFFFPSKADTHALGLGVEAWKGFYTSVRPSFGQLLVNVNVCMTAFYTPGNLAEAMIQFNRQSRGGMPKDFKSGLKVTTTHLGYKKRKPLRAITGKSARDTTFDCEELGGRVSVEQYFLKKYKIKLKHAHDLPVIDIGTPSKPNFLPAEICEIEPGVRYTPKLNDKETAEMIRYACNRPRVNAESIVHQGLPKLGLTRETSTSTLNGFGIEIDSEMISIPGRELPPPSLSYKVGRPNVKDGSWNIVDVKFQRGAVISSWWVMPVVDGNVPFNGPQDPNLKKLVEGFAAKCRSSGMAVPDGIPRLVQTPRLPPRREGDLSRREALDVIRKTLDDALVQSKGRKPSVVLVLLFERDNFIYPGIKRLGDVILGLHTVHMLIPKLWDKLNDPKKMDQYYSNVALKLNTKLGGINHTLDHAAMQWLTTKKTMLVGMDVTHPGFNTKEGSPSIAAVVASVEDNFVQYPASLRVQVGKEEMIQELRDMMIERLLLYEKKNRRLPERIIIFRDGVSEGQFNKVLEDELPKVQEAFKKFNTRERKVSYEPKLSIIICGKRHHARFYPTNSAFADKNGNTRPGTVVDKGVTAVFEFDWYLQAHAGLQGTVRPTHYTMVYDENRLGADEIQQGINTVSYLYGRATKAVSLIPPAYYADVACERGRHYLNDFLGGDDKASGSSGSAAKRDKEEEKARVFNAAKQMWGEGLHADIRDSMFYM